MEKKEIQGRSLTAIKMETNIQAGMFPIQVSYKSSSGSQRPSPKGNAKDFVDANATFIRTFALQDGFRLSLALSSTTTRARLA
jgi:hypothetical protein